MERQRRQHGRGSVFFRGDGYWVAQVDIGKSPEGKRRRRTLTAKTYCGIIKRFSAEYPPTPDRPLHPRVVTMRLARERGTHTAQEWYALCRKAGNRCAYCGERGRMTKDHDVPVTVGGSDAIDNIVPACLACNMEKKQLTGREYRHWRTLMGKGGGSPIEDARSWAATQGLGVQ